MVIAFRRAPTRPSRFLRLLFLLLAILTYLWITERILPEPIVSPLPKENGSKKRTFSFPKQKNEADLRKVIEKIAEPGLKNYSVLVQDYGSSFSMGINESQIFAAASVNKLPILTSLYYLAQKGEINLEDTITLQEEDIQDYGTGTIRYDPPGTTYSIKTLAKVMVKKSDNTAAYILARHIIGAEKIQTLMNEWGLTQTDIERNTTSNRDAAILLRKTYEGKVANVALTQELLGFLKDGDAVDRLPALLPKDTIVYHKDGTGEQVFHDVGIVSRGKTTYYIGILIGDVVNEEEAKKTLAQISKSVFNFMR